MVAAIFGCIFGILGIYTIGAVFVPLSALCSIVAFLTGAIQMRAAVILMAVVSSCVTIAAFIVSPSAWLLFAAIFGSGIGAKHEEGAPRKSATSAPSQADQGDCQSRWIKDATVICH